MEIMQIQGHFQNARTKKRKLIYSLSFPVACENIRFSSLFAAEKSEEKRMFSQATFPGLLQNSHSFFQALFYLNVGFLSISYTRAKKVMFRTLMTR